MQDIHGFLGNGGCGRPIFSDRRMRAAAHHHQRALNCLRCDSLNTKFCYYNNYNLSQPRYFCKNCRRYWTKGGVLRNVPIGGGCRMSKRASKRKNSPSAAPQVDKSNSESSGESTFAKAHSSGDTVGCRSAMGMAAVVSEAGSEHSERPPVAFDSVATSAAVPCDVMNANFEAVRDYQGVAGIETAGPGAGLFTDIGGLLLGGDQNQSLVSVGSGGLMGLAPFRMHQQNQVNRQQLLQNPTAEAWQMKKIDGGGQWGPGVVDQTVHVDLAGADWHGGVGSVGAHPGIYGLTSGSNGHRSQSSNECYGSDDCHLYIPP